MPIGTLARLPFSNSFAGLPAHFHTRLDPCGLPAPALLAYNEALAAELGIDPADIGRPEGVDAFAGNRPLPGSAPLAAVYSGHQFGVWAGQLGDGRAHLLGGLERNGKHWEIQLKGAGSTPYSRGADGRAVLRSSIREYLASEAMAALGIPTTRALCLVGSPLPVRRERFESAAVVTRIAPSFVRFGSFEHWAAAGRNDALRQLADYVIDHFRPACRDDAAPYAALLADVAQRTGELIGAWMAMGFMHGVMNTDNMSILGLTLDYGPYGFMEAFNAGHICNHSDHAGRYSFENQPYVGQWNLYCLAEALHPLIGDRDDARAVVDAHYGPAFGDSFAGRLRARLGLAAPDEAADEELIGDTLSLLHTQHLDLTGFFRALSRLPATPPASPAGDAPLRDQFIDRAAGDAWLARWRARQARTPWPEVERQTAMLAANPRYTLRNWLAEQAIRRAEAGDPSEIHRLHACLSQPYTDNPDWEAYAAPAPEWAADLEVSCSS